MDDFIVKSEKADDKNVSVLQLKIHAYMFGTKHLYRNTLGCQ